jgi:hypothetical protein
MKSKPIKSEDAIVPTPERAQRGPIERTERPVLPVPGEFETPYVAIDLLEGMLRRGVISAEEKLAGERFRSWFALAHLDGLRAADLARPVVDGGRAQPEILMITERARNEIWQAIRWLGGISSTEAVCIWHVIGLDESLREWSSKTPKTANHSVASGVLLVAIERLARMPWRGPNEKIG